MICQEQISRDLIGRSRQGIDDYLLPFHFLQITGHGFSEHLVLEERSGLSFGHDDLSEFREISEQGIAENSMRFRTMGGIIFGWAKLL